MKKILLDIFYPKDFLIFSVTLYLFIRYIQDIIYYDITLVYIILTGAYLIQEISKKNNRKVIAILSISSFIIVFIQIIISQLK